MAKNSSPMRILMCLSLLEGSFTSRITFIIASAISTMYTAWLALTRGAPDTTMYVQPTVSTWRQKIEKRESLKSLVVGVYSHKNKRLLKVVNALNRQSTCRYVSFTF